MSTLGNHSGNRILVFLGGLTGAAGVMAGAFGAHLLHHTLETSGHLDTWKTAVLYNLVHAAVLVATGARSDGSRCAGWLWLAGIVLFSGSLYALSLGGPGWLGPVTPVGGLLFIAGWSWFGVSQFRSQSWRGP